MNAIIVGVMSLFTGPGKSAVPVTKNDEQMKKLLEAGVNGIVTDRTDIAVKLLKN